MSEFTTKLEDQIEYVETLEERVDALSFAQKIIYVNTSHQPTQKDFRDAWLAAGHTLPIPAGVEFIWENEVGVSRTYQTLKDYFVPRDLLPLYANKMPILENITFIELLSNSTMMYFTWPFSSGVKNAYIDQITAGNLDRSNQWNTVSLPISSGDNIVGYSPTLNRIILKNGNLVAPNGAISNISLPPATTNLKFDVRCEYLIAESATSTVYIDLVANTTKTKQDYEQSIQGKDGVLKNPMCRYILRAIQNEVERETINYESSFCINPDLELSSIFHPTTNPDDNPYKFSPDGLSLMHKFGFFTALGSSSYVYPQDNNNFRNHDEYVVNLNQLGSNPLPLTPGLISFRKHERMYLTNKYILLQEKTINLTLDSNQLLQISTPTTSTSLGAIRHVNESWTPIVVGPGPTAQLNEFPANRFNIKIRFLGDHIEIVLNCRNTSGAREVTRVYLGDHGNDVFQYSISLVSSSANMIKWTETSVYRTTGINTIKYREGLSI